MGVPIQQGQPLLLPGVIVKVDDTGNIQIQVFDRVITVDKTDLSNWAMAIQPTAESVASAVRADSLAATALVQPSGQPNAPAVRAGSLAAATQVRAIPVNAPASVAVAPSTTAAGVFSMHPGCVPPADIFTPGADFRSVWSQWQIKMGKKSA